MVRSLVAALTRGAVRPHRLARRHLGLPDRDTVLFVGRLDAETTRSLARFTEIYTGLAEVHR